ncbi:MAG: beta-lactamase family protein [Saprospiraceae bacterium]|nr:beta-lactamase family protein [Saprospiraceae bacterium]
MRLYACSLVILFIGLTLFSCKKENNLGGQEPPADLPIEERLENIITEKVGPDKLLGVSVSIRIGEEERWKLTGGLSKPGVPVQSDMSFGIASITKTVVAAAILKLEEEGQLSLSDSISKYLTLDKPQIDENVTIFQLLNHFSGIKNYFQGANLWSRVEQNLDTPIPPRELVDFIGNPVFPVGRRYEYSNSNYLLLGLIIEAVSGQSIGEFFRSRFWEPLQLNRIYFADDEAPTGPIATPWRDGDGDGTLEDISSAYKTAYHSVFWTAADVFSTASDLSLWAYHLLEGDALSQASKSKMQRYVEIDDPIFIGYGLGLRRVQIAGRILWGHTGGMRGYGGYMFYDPLKKITIVMLNNQSRSADGPILRHELFEEMFAEVLKEVQ